MLYDREEILDVIAYNTRYVRGEYCYIFTIANVGQFEKALDLNSITDVEYNPGAKP